MNTSTYNRTRWLTLFGTIVTQFALGSVYTWSLFNSALSDKLGAPVSQVAFSFGLLSLGLAISSSRLPLVLMVWAASGSNLSMPICWRPLASKKPS